MEDGPPRVMRRSFTRQCWRDVVFLHWRVDEREVAPHLPPGTEPDLVDGSAWMGVIGLRMTGLRIVGAPYPSFLELNLRLYSRDADGHRAVVFRSMEASEPVFATASRVTLRLPYTWAAMRYDGTDGLASYATRRRVPAAGGAGVRFGVQAGAPLDAASEIEEALTARWSLHQWWYGATLRMPIHHDPWPLHRARLTEWHDDGLLAASGLPALTEPPESVLYAPATTVRFGLPVRL